MTNKWATYLQFRPYLCSFQDWSRLISLLWTSIQNSIFSYITNFTTSTNVALHGTWTRRSIKKQDECQRSGEMANLSVAGILTLLMFEIFMLHILKWSADDTIVLRHGMASWCSWCSILYSGKLGLFLFKRVGEEKVFKWTIMEMNDRPGVYDGH